MDRWLVAYIVFCLILIIVFTKYLTNKNYILAQGLVLQIENEQKFIAAVNKSNELMERSLNVKPKPSSSPKKKTSRK